MAEMSQSTTGQSDGQPDSWEQLRMMTRRDPVNILPEVVPQVVDLIGPSESLQSRRWGAEFLAEGMSQPSLPGPIRQRLAVIILPRVKEMLEPEDQDPYLMELYLSVATTIYLFVFKHVIDNPSDTTAWNSLTAIKVGIMRRADNANSDIKPMCIKFFEEVVKIQTAGPIVTQDPRLAAQNEISISMVPPDHPLITPTNLQPETIGLLDRVLGVLQETGSHSTLVTATLNSIMPLVYSRPALEAKILNVLLAFNPFATIESSTDSWLLLETNVTSMYKTVRVLLAGYNKRKPGSVFHARIHARLGFLNQNAQVILAGDPRQQPSATAANDSNLTNNATAATQAQSVGTETPFTPPIIAPSTSMAAQAGPVSLAQIFTLTNDEGLRTFPVGYFSWAQADAVVRASIRKVDQHLLNNAINIVRQRWLQLQEATQVVPATNAWPASTYDDDEEEYEPYESPQSTSQTNQNVAENVTESGVEMGTFVMKQPPPMTQEEAALVATEYYKSLLELVDTSEDAPTTSVKRSFHSSLFDFLGPKRFWFITLVRIATRSLAGLGEGKGPQSEEIRELVCNYVVEDFRGRLELATDWLSEEWFNDKIQGVRFPQNYEKWLIRYLDAIMPYLDATKDRKTLLRFVGEVADLPDAVFERIKKLAQDPDSVTLATDCLHYLIRWKVPAKKQSIDALIDLYQNCEGAKTAAATLLKKFCPEALASSPEATAPTAEPAEGEDA